MPWFPFSGTNPSNPTHYSAPVSSQPTCPALPEQMCALQAAEDINNRPVITAALKDEIINCLQNQINDTNVKLTER